MKQKTLPVFLLIVALLLAACGTGGSEFDRQRAAWDGQAVTHYRFTVAVLCFCPFANVPVTYEVLDGQVVNASVGPEVDLGGGTLEQVTSMTAEFDTVEKLFAYVERALNEADKVEVTYDASYGFPSQVSVDWIELAVDDELAFTITGFEALP
ncbi:MAG: DUF6174 domain-containing protein [Chloroflexota bacterium]